MAKVKAPRTPLSADELKLELQEAINILTDACAAFDTDREYSAKTISVILRVLFYHHGQSQSLIRTIHSVAQDSRYNLNRIEFTNTCPDFDSGKVKQHSFFVGLKISLDPVKMWYFPPLAEAQGATKPQESFEDWWEKRPVFVYGAGTKFSRKQLVTLVANQAGGAHVDPGVEVEYYDLVRNNAMKNSIEVRDKDGNLRVSEKPSNNIVFVALRQIAHETLMTLNATFPEYFPNGVYQGVPKAGEAVVGTEADAG